ncbi:MAG: 4-alpha-glucanotransferase [Chloroflexi bacterium]|nr:4-alpha-glucanotransferase [Chloroflexota bacterium]
MDLFPRSSGILLHPTSLPGRFGIGDLGEWAYRFVDWLVEHGQSIWQVLPLGPTSYGDSPYQTLSAFAGNTNLISLDHLVEDGWLTSDDLADIPDFPTEQIDYGWVIYYHDQKLELAYERFAAQNDSEQRKALDAWSAQNAFWLDDWALFFTLKQKNEGRPWVEWPDNEALQDGRTLSRRRSYYADQLDKQRFFQWVFHKQWFNLKTYANERGVRIFGDIPIFVAHDSADVWANRDAFYLDDKGNPEIVAGVPPDYFSATGQRWGNPLYRWEWMKNRRYEWWLNRLKSALSVVDYIRVDHFRGFDAYWEIPGEEETAINGEWVSGPGSDFFKAVQKEMGDLPIIAEDLGVITQTVEQLRDDFNLPGMKVLQFAWSDPKNPFLPHNHRENNVVYSGTHDNNTTVGWWKDELDDGARGFMADYLNYEVTDIIDTFMRMGMASVAHTFIMPMQDILGLGSESRMNTPGRLGGNWTWRFTPEQLRSQVNDKLTHYTWLYQRRPDQQEKEYGDVAVKAAS